MFLVYKHLPGRPGGWRQVGTADNEFEAKACCRRHTTNSHDCFWISETLGGTFVSADELQIHDPRSSCLKP